MRNKKEQRELMLERLREAAAHLKKYVRAALKSSDHPVHERVRVTTGRLVKYSKAALASGADLDEVAEIMLGALPATLWDATIAEWERNPRKRRKS